MGITKCIQTKDNVIRMASVVFPDKGVPQIEELTEGMCNVAYRLTYKDGFQTILKISSPIQTGFMTNERHLMDAEVKAMELASRLPDVKVASVYAYDTSRSICEGDYFFMECLEGTSWISVIDSLDEEVNCKLRREVGRIQKQLSAITNHTFGLLGDSEHQFDKLFDFIYFLINNVLTDAENRKVVIGVPKEKILTALKRDRLLFESVKTPSLVHWDMWEGNIFIKDGRISGIIDWERAMWGEPYMDDRFREHNRHSDFLKGFGICELSNEELKRIYWYDVLLYLTMMTEVTYREYEDDGQYHWVKPKFERAWEALQK